MTSNGNGNGNREPSEEAVDLLARELEQIVQSDDPQAMRDEARAVLGRERSRIGDFLGTYRLLIGVTFGTALMLGVMLSLLTGSWLFVALASLVHAAVVTVIAGVAISTASEVEKPSPETVAELEHAGVSDPEQKLNEAIADLAGEPDEGRLKRVLRDDAGDGGPEGGAAEEIAQQQRSNTPAAEPTRLNSTG